MNTKECLNQMEASVEEYLKDLEGLNMEQLLRKPAEDEWSLGQMYVHLIQSALYMGIRNMEACRLSSETPETAEPRTEIGNAVFTSGSFPPIAIKVPASKEYTPQQPESKEQLTEGMKMVIGKMRELEPLLDSIPASRTSPHPRFGALNAKEWFAMTEMHYRHHFLQKKRLEAFLESAIASN
jgi:hypothetical protein